jgi:hypothetical protein
LFSFMAMGSGKQIFSNHSRTNCFIVCSVMTMNPTQFEKTLSLRHALATLAYRAAKALRDVPPNFLNFRAAEGSRSAGEILAHLADLMDWALSQAQGEERWRSEQATSWDAGTQRFFTALGKLDEYLASDEALRVPAEKLFQGAIADAFTHVGQISMLRRLSSAPVRAENYSVAKIEIGRTGRDQCAPVREFD